MKTAQKIQFLGIALFSLLACGSPASTTMAIVTDNDFAVFAGTVNSITRLVYQNNVVWNDQIADLSSFSFDLQAGETNFYLLAMGGGGEENVSGEINGVNLTSISVLQSSNIAAYLTDYNASSVTDGSYTVQLLDVQLALASLGLWWGDPTLTDSQTVVSLSGFGLGYSFDDSNAVIFTFPAESVNVDTVPEPSAVGLLALGAGGMAWAARRRRSN